MRAIFTIFVASLTFAAACKKKENAGEGSAASAGSNTAAASGTMAASGAAPGANADTTAASGAAAGSGAAGSGAAANAAMGSNAAAGSGSDSAAATTGSGSVPTDMPHRAGMCPSTVLGATTKSELKGKAVVVTIESTDKDAIAAIQKRVDELLAEKKDAPTGVGHDMKGTHGGAQGLCPVYVPDGAKATAKHEAKGVVITITPKDKPDELAKEIEGRIAKAADWVKANVKPGDKLNQGGVGGGKAGDGMNHSGKGDGKGLERKKGSGGGKGTGGGGGAGTGGGGGAGTGGGAGKPG